MVDSVMATHSHLILCVDDELVGLRVRKLLLERAKVLTEPAASCTLAAAMRMKEKLRPGSHVALILCGGNLGVDDLSEYHAKFLKS